MPAKTFRERLHKGYAQVMEPSGPPLADEKSRYQRIKIFDTVANGRVLTLDDIVQITTRDESAYAEMLTHLPLLEHGNETFGRSLLHVLVLRAGQLFQPAIAFHLFLQGHDHLSIPISPAHLSHPSHELFGSE